MIMSHEEQRRMLVEILTKLVDSDLTSDELSLLAHHCGISIAEFYGPTEADMFNEQTRLAA